MMIAGVTALSILCPEKNQRSERKRESRCGRSRIEPRCWRPSVGRFGGVGRPAPNLAETRAELSLLSRLFFPERHRTSQGTALRRSEPPPAAVEPRWQFVAFPSERPKPAVDGADGNMVEFGRLVSTTQETLLMSAVPKPFLTPQEYLARERRAETKSAYLRGEVFARAGASRKHNLVWTNVAAELRQRLRESDCEVYQSDMRVKVSPTGLYTYPDVTVACGEPQFEDAEVDTLLNPKVVVEVLSPSTADYDRGGKFTHYRRLPSLRE